MFWVRKLFEFIFAVFVSFFFALGLSEVLHGIKLLLYKRRGKRKNIILTFLSEDDAKKQLNYTLEKYRWNGKDYADSIVFLSDSLDAETSEYCVEAVKQYKNIYICSRSTLLQIIDGLKEDKNGKSGSSANP